jgi:hypothetical protein
VTGRPLAISDETRARIQAIFAEGDAEEAALRASLSPEQYRRQAAEKDIAYCRARLDPDFDLFVQFPHLRPDAATREAYEARIRDLEHFLATGGHIDEDDL